MHNFINLYISEESQNYKNKSKSEILKGNAAKLKKDLDSRARNGEDVGFTLMGLGIAKARSAILKPNQQNLNEEKDYYAIINGIIVQAIEELKNLKFNNTAETKAQTAYNAHKVQSSEEKTKESKVVNIDKNNLDSSKMKTNTQESKSSFLILIIIIVICVIWYNSSKNKNDNSVNTSNITNEISTNSLNDNNTQSSATEDKWYEYERSFYDFSYYVPKMYFMKQSYSHYIEDSKRNMYFYFEDGGDEKKLSVDGSYTIVIDASEGHSAEDELHYWSTAGRGEDCKTTTSEIVEEYINGYNWKKISYKDCYNMETYTRYFTGIIYAIEFKGKCYIIIYQVDNHTGDIDTAILDSMKPTFRFR